MKNHLHTVASVAGPRSRPGHRSSLSPTGIALLCCLGLTLVAGPRARAESLDREQYLMGTRFQLHLLGPDPAHLEATSERVFREVARLEQVFSSWRKDSDLSLMNARLATGAPRVSPDLFAALEASLRLAELSRGTFDPTIEPLLVAHDLRGAGRQPSADELRTALAAVDYQRLELEPDTRTVRLPEPGAAINLGGIGKGIALDRVAEILREAAVPAALVNFAGQLLAFGEPMPGEPWTIEVADPHDRNRVAVQLAVRNASVATSGQSEHTFIVDGREVGHILDPHTGEPVPAWGSATVISESATMADALSTALFVMGPDAAIQFAANRDDLAAIILEQSNAAGDPSLSLAGQSPALRAVLPPVTSSVPLVDLMAQAGGDPSTPPSNAELARRLDILATELEDLKLGEVVAQVVPAHGLGPAAAKIYQTRGGVSIGGYGEMLYENFAAEHENGTPSGKIDQLDFLRNIIYFGYKFSDGLLFNSEIEFEHASTGVAGSASVEFAYLDFIVNEQFGARAGMLLVPTGFVNELHEPPIFLGARRPDVEQKIIPTTWRANGAGIHGEPAPGFSYRAYVIEGLDGAGFADGSGVRGGRQKGSKAKAEDMGVVVRAELEQPAGWLVGGSAYTGGSGQGATDADGNVFTARTTLVEAHGQFRRHGLQARALVARWQIDDVEQLNALAGRTGDRSIGETLLGWYVEAGFDLMTRRDRSRELSLIPYVRYEELNTQDAVPAGFTANPALDQKVVTAGVAFYPHPQVVVKGDYQWRHNEADTGVDQVNLALGFLY